MGELEMKMLRVVRDAEKVKFLKIEVYVQNSVSCMNKND